MAASSRTFKTVRLVQVPLPYWCISTRNRFEITILIFCEAGTLESPPLPAVAPEVVDGHTLKLCLNLRQHFAASHNNKLVNRGTLPPLKHVSCDALRVGTIESLHCGDGAVDDARFLGRDVNGNAAVNAHRSLDGLASSLAGQF